MLRVKRLEKFLPSSKITVNFSQHDPSNVEGGSEVVVLRGVERSNVDGAKKQ